MIQNQTQKQGQRQKKTIHLLVFTNVPEDFDPKNGNSGVIPITITDSMELALECQKRMREVYGCYPVPEFGFRSLNGLPPNGVYEIIDLEYPSLMPSTWKMAISVKYKRDKKREGNQWNITCELLTEYGKKEEEKCVIIGHQWNDNGISPYVNKDEYEEDKTEYEKIFILYKDDYCHYAIPLEEGDNIKKWYYLSSGRITQDEKGVILGYHIHCIHDKKYEINKILKLYDTLYRFNYANMGNLSFDPNMTMSLKVNNSLLPIREFIHMESNEYNFLYEDLVLAEVRGGHIVNDYRYREEDKDDKFRYITSIVSDEYIFICGIFSRREYAMEAGDIYKSFYQALHKSDNTRIDIKALPIAQPKVDLVIHNEETGDCVEVNMEKWDIYTTRME